MSGFNLKTFYRLLANRNIDVEALLIWLQSKRNNCENELPGAWRRIVAVYRVEGYEEAMEHVNNLISHIKWHEIMTLYIKGLGQAEVKDSYVMLWNDYVVCPENIEQINNLIKGQVKKETDSLTKSYNVLKNYVSSNYPLRAAPPTIVRYKGVIAYCTLHKMSLTWTGAQQRNCFYRNGLSTCNNLIFVRSSPPSLSFWQSPEGQSILRSTSMSNRARYRQD